ncbi:MAG: ammonium transporter, partial [Planctomycetes bacterium]|nr:ammonium transporter [Planctomycetota bacterium]
MNAFAINLGGSLVIRSHLSTLLALSVLCLAGFGQASWALEPEKLAAPRELAQADPKKSADSGTKESKEEKDPKKDVKDVKKDPEPTLSEVNTLAKKGVEDAAAAAKLATEKATEESGKATTEGKRRGDTAWMMVASALVLLMVPGLALFYGGMVRKKNVLATMMQSYAAMAVVGLFWIAFGYGLAFGPSVIKLSILGVEDGGIIGWSSDLFFLRGIGSDAFLPAYNIPVYTHVMFQGMFAIITPALISGAIAERIRFWPFCIFMISWVTLVYCPLAHMVWAWDWFYAVPVDSLKGLGGVPVGLLGKMGALDFAGGTVVHIAAGTAGLACALVLPKRLGYPSHTIQPNSMVLTLIGAGLLWVGWFGFNGGSSLTADALGSSAFAATQAAAAGAGLSWILVEWLLKGKPTALGLASGIVAGLVAVTPASGFVPMWGGATIGIIAGVVCYFSVQLKSICGYDDSLDAFGVHAVGGFLGAVLTG